VDVDDAFPQAAMVKQFERDPRAGWQRSFAAPHRDRCEEQMAFVD
jgi:hypothetical protein